MVMAMTPRPTAVFCFGDLLALGTLAGLRHHGGLSVPDEISVMGFDGIGEGAMAEPALTSISIDRESIGTVAAEFLLDRLADSSRDRQARIFAPTLRFGATTGRCPKR